MAAAVFAVRADFPRPDGSWWLIALDVIVGLVFVVAAWWALGPATERWLMAGVGLAWLAGSSVPMAGSLHQTVLLIALVAFPNGRLRRWPARAVAVLALPVAVGVVTQAGVAALFAAGGLCVVLDRRRITIGRTYPALACGGVVAALGSAWAVGQVLPEVADPTSSRIGSRQCRRCVPVCQPGGRSKPRAAGRRGIARGRVVWTRRFDGGSAWHSARCAARHPPLN